MDQERIAIVGRRRVRAPSGWAARREAPRRSARAEGCAGAARGSARLLLRRRQGRRHAPTMKDLLGGKGAEPRRDDAASACRCRPGFTITTEVCTAFYASGRQLPDGARGAGARARCARVEKVVGRALRRRRAARCSSRCAPARRVSMPGMMDTVLNLGLNDATVRGPGARVRRRALRLRLPTAASSRCTATSCSACPHERFEAHPRGAEARRRGVDARHRALRGRRSSELVARVPARSCASTPGAPFPEDPERAALGRRRRRVRLVAERPRASPTGKLHDIPGAGAPPSTCRRWCSATWATTAPPASRSRATRRPARTRFYGEYLVNAQGEDVVAGIRTPQPDQRARARAGTAHCRRSRRRCPTAYARAGARSASALETHYRDMQDIEFTIQQRQALDAADAHGKRTARAAVRIAVDMVQREADHDATRRSLRVDAAHARPAAAPDARSRRRERDVDRQGPAGVAGRGRRRGRASPPTTPRRAAQRGREGDPRAHRDLARGHPRHARRARASSPRAAA